MQPIARTLTCCAVGLAAALAGIDATNREPTTEDALRAHPRRTRGCPGLQEQLLAWQEDLALEHWQVELICGLPARHEDNLLGQAQPIRSERRAKIWIRDGLPLLLQQSVLVHELIHVGVAGDRWWVPAGRKEEEFVLKLERQIFLARRQQLQALILRNAQREARARRVGVTELGGSTAE